jgi:hypothetical protein
VESEANMTAQTAEAELEADVMLIEMRKHDGTDG